MLPLIIVVAEYIQQVFSSSKTEKGRKWKNTPSETKFPLDLDLSEWWGRLYEEIVVALRVEAFCVVVGVGVVVAWIVAWPIELTVLLEMELDRGVSVHSTMCLVHLE